MSHYRLIIDHALPAYQSLVHRDAEPTPRPTWAVRIRGTLRLWRERRAARHALAQVDARSLRDAGIAPDMVAYEIGQPFWRDLRDWRA